MPNIYHGLVRALKEGVVFWFIIMIVKGTFGWSSGVDFLFLLVGLALALELVGKMKYWSSEYIVGFGLGTILYSLLLSLQLGVDSLLVLFYGLLRIALRMVRGVFP